MVDLTIEYKHLYPIGEIVDKLTIILLKLQNMENITQEDRKILWSQADACMTIIWEDFKREATERRAANLLSNLCLQIVSLSNSQAKQWGHENEIRRFPSKEAAYAARRQNNERIRIKNQINKLLGGTKEVDSREMKEYEGEVPQGDYEKEAK